MTKLHNLQQNLIIFCAQANVFLEDLQHLTQHAELGK